MKCECETVNPTTPKDTVPKGEMDLMAGEEKDEVSTVAEGEVPATMYVSNAMRDHGFTA